jgi:hypothetical protein
MNLKSAVRCHHPDSCFACKWAHRDITIWPQSYEDQGTGTPEDWYGHWHVYISVHDADLRTAKLARSGHRTYQFCMEHWTQLQAVWIQIAQDEVNLQKLWDNHIERTEE